MLQPQKQNGGAPDTGRYRTIGVIAVSETRFTSEVFDNEIQLIGFLSRRVDIMNCRRVVVIMYTKSTLTIRAVETVVHNSGVCGLLRCRLKCKRQDT